MKITLKTAILSVAILTFLSACGAASITPDNNGANNNGANNNGDDNNGDDNNGDDNNGDDNNDDDNNGNDNNGNDNNGNNNNNNNPVVTTTNVSDRVVSVQQVVTGPPLFAVVASVDSTIQDVVSIGVKSDGDDGDEGAEKADCPCLTLTVNNAEHIAEVGFIFGEVSLYGADRDLAAYLLIIGGTHATIQGDYIYYDTPAAGETHRRFGYTTIGVQTPTSDVTAQSATATYTGALALTIPINRGSNNDYYFTSGTLTMAVDFDGNTVSGTAPLVVQTIGGPSAIGTATFASAPIVGNGFEGTFTLDSASRTAVDLTDNPTGNYAGNFFGAAADDIAGVLELNGTNAQGATPGYGAFRGDRQVQEAAQ